MKTIPKTLLFWVSFLSGVWFLPLSEANYEKVAPDYRAQGYEFQQRKQFDDAIIYYQKAIALDPSYPAPHNDLGIVYEEKGWFDRAEQEYLQTLAIDPHFVDAYANLALLYERRGMPEKALVYWRKRAEFGHPNDPWTRVAIDRVSLLSKKIELPPPAPAPPKGPGELLAPREGVPGESQEKAWPALGRSAISPQEEKQYEEFGRPPTMLEYVIGPGDTLAVNVWQQPDLSQTVTVRPDGRISAPLVDDLYVSGLTPAQVDAEVTQRLSKTVREPEVSVVMSGFASKGVFVLGEVSRPGRYPLTQPTTAMEIIAQAGQWKDSGVLNSVMVVRRGWTKDPQITRVDLTKVVKGGDVSKDMVLQDGDVVFIPRNFVARLDNFLTYFTKHLFGSAGGLVSGTPVQIVEPPVKLNN